jgi:hypothetical protein
MDEDAKSYELSPEGDAKIKAVDSYLEEAIRDGRPIETLIATKRLGEIINDRAKESARVATADSWSWTDVGRALGMTRQAAHEKLRARVRDEIDKGLAKLERAEESGRAKITRRAIRRREGLDKAPSSPGGRVGTPTDRRVGTRSTREAQPESAEGTPGTAPGRTVGAREARP